MPRSINRSRLRFIGFGLGAVLNPAFLQGRTARIAGRTYTHINSLAGRFGMGHGVIAARKKERIASRWSEITFTIHKREMMYNDVKVALGYGIAESGGNLWLSNSDVTSTIEPLLIPQQTNPKPRLYRIVLDPGHGGRDSGAENKSMGLREKTLALDVAHRVKRKLAGLGYQVLMTRETDKKVELPDRAAFANRAKADLFISIHFNSFPRSDAEGIETFVMAPKGQPPTARHKQQRSDNTHHKGNNNDTWNLIAGYELHRKLTSDFKDQPDRGVKRARFQVLKEVGVPAMLLELGFMSHPPTARQLKKSSHLEALAESIKDGVFAYQKRLNAIRGI